MTNKLHRLRTLVPATPLHALKTAYIIAFCAVGLILFSSFAVNRYTLYREGISRQIAALESRQAVRSQRIGRDAVLFLVPGSHAATIREMQADVAGMEADRLLLNRQYLGLYPSFAQIDGGHGRALAVYFLVRTTALDLIRLDQTVTYPSDKARLSKTGEGTDITTLFYKEQEQLQNIQAAQAIINHSADATIDDINTIETVSFIVAIITLLIEALFVLVPAIRHFDEAQRRATAPPTTPSETATVPPSSTPV